MKGIFKFLIVLGVVVVVPVAAFYGCFYEPSGNDVVYTEGFDNSKFLPGMMVSAFSNTKNDGKVSMNVTRDDLNNIIHSALESAENVPTQYLNQAYVDIEGNNYIFNVGVSVPLFKTKAKLYTTLNVEKDTTGDKYVFTINDCKLGRIPGIAGLAKSIVSNFITDDTVSQALANSGLHMEVSIKDGRIVYPESNLVNDMKNLLGTSGGSESEMLFAVLDDFLQNDYMTLSTEGQISGVIDLEPFTRNTYGLLDSTKVQNLDLDGCVTKLKTLKSGSIIDGDHMQKVFEYLIHGYSQCDQDTKDYLEGKDFSSIGIADVTTYDGIVHKNNRSISEIIGEKTVSIADLALNKNITFMTESEVNEYVAGSGMIGYTYLVHDDSYENLSYITVDNFYSNLYREDGVGKFSLVAGVNFNGYDTFVAFDMKQVEESTQDYVISFTVDNIYLGEYETNGALSSYLFKLMSTSLAGDDTIKVDEPTRTISVDFSNSIDAATKAAVAMIGTPKMSVEGDGLSDNNGRVVASIA